MPLISPMALRLREAGARLKLRLPSVPEEEKVEAGDEPGCTSESASESEQEPEPRWKRARLSRAVAEP